MENLIRTEKRATTPEEVRTRHESNRAAWNEGAAAGYTPENEETIAFLKAGKSNLHPVERAYLGSLLPACQTAIHLQCASGRDTLSLLNEGVRYVIGVDISDVHIENARHISAALNAAAEWHRCDVLDTPHTLDGLADLVYTGRGAWCWLSDLNAWAQVVARLLKPGGVVSIFDDHPLAWLFDTDSENYQYSGVDYFSHAESGPGWPATYIGEKAGPIEKLSRKYECIWTLSQFFNAFTQAGLTVTHFEEHPDAYWDCLPNLKPELRGRIPLTFSMMARKP